MNKDFFKTIFHSDVGHVYEYIGVLPDDVDPESSAMNIHVTEDFVRGHGDNMVSTMIVRLPNFNNKIVLFCNSVTDVNVSDEFVLLTNLVPDPVVEVVQPEVIQEEAPQEETTQEETTPEQTQETPGGGQ
jgi:hypothetical protein